jgi:hypothetical protein
MAMTRAEGGSIEIPVQYKEFYPCSRETYLEVYCKLLKPKAIDLQDPRANPFIIPVDILFWDRLEHYTELYYRRTREFFTYWENLFGALFYSGLSSELNQTLVSEDMVGIDGGRRLFFSSAGFLGLAPLTAGEGDTVCLFLGGKVLYVIRPLADGYFQYIGECFVYGLMHGEAIQGLPEERIKDFVLA